MISKRLLILATGLAIAGGCATMRRVQTAAPATAPTTAEVKKASDAQLTLDQIEPKPALGAASTQPALAPLDAIERYARARDLLLQNPPQRYTALTLIEEAIRMDPNSFELRMALGKVYTEVGSVDRAIEAFKDAAKIKPDSLEVQAELGRVYQSRNNTEQAIERFRLAMLSSDYAQNDSMAAVVDYRLAVALQQKGYARAALQCYEKLLYRLEHGLVGTRVSADIGYLISRPDLLYEEMGKLHESLGELGLALDAWQAVADRAPGDFDRQSRVVRMLIKMRRNKDAINSAAELVRRFHASSESIALLRDVYQQVGSQGAFTDAMRRLYKEHPNDRSILFALADTLAADNQLAQARDLLEKGIESHNGDVEIAERLYDIYTGRDQVLDAARLIIRITAAHPDTTAELNPLFMDLTSWSRKNSLRLAVLQKLEIPAAQEASRQYWLWHVASTWTRQATARTALEAAANASPPFDPACRAQLNWILSRSDFDPAAKQKAAKEFIDSVQARGRADLAAELRGLLALNGNDAVQATRSFDQAVEMAKGAPSPDLQLERAVAVLRQGNSPRFEQLIWKLISDRPRYDSAYLGMINYLKQTGASQQAWSLVNKWLAADPNSPQAKIQHVIALIEQRRADEALALLKKLYEQRPDDADVVQSLAQLLTSAGQRQQLIDLLEAQRTKHPGNRLTVDALVSIYAEQGKIAEATRAIDSARATVANDPDMLYTVAHLYQRIDQPQVTEQVLEDVLKLDPTHPSASNDLGYSWADEGRNIDRAEAMIRTAVQAEPDNPSYLDSLGWVLYKRSRFDEAYKFLQEAAAPMESADPVVLDHLGDVLYRLNRAPEARTAWQQSLERLGQVNGRTEFKDLQLQLQSKLRQSELGQPVKVAPVVGSDQQRMQATR